MHCKLIVDMLKLIRFVMKGAVVFFKFIHNVLREPSPCIDSYCRNAREEGMGGSRDTSADKVNIDLVRYIILRPIFIKAVHMYRTKSLSVVHRYTHSCFSC